MSKLFNIRAPEADIAGWKELAKAQGLSASAWARGVLNHEVGHPIRVQSRAMPGLKPESTLEASESGPQPRKRSKGLSASGCKHEGYEHRKFCYRCGTRK